MVDVCLGVSVLGLGKEIRYPENLRWTNGIKRISGTNWQQVTMERASKGLHSATRLEEEKQRSCSGNFMHTS